MPRWTDAAALAALMTLTPLAFAQAQTTPAAPPEGGAVTAPALPAIVVTPVTRKLLRDTVRASGFVAAVEEVQVQPQIQGQQIEALLADVGDHVAEGQVLARLSTSTLELQKSQLTASRASAAAAIAQAQASVIEAQASADEANRVTARTSALRTQGAVSQASAETATSNAAAAAARVTAAQQGLIAAQAQQALVEAQIADIELQLARTEIRATVAGKIVSRNAQLGGIASTSGAPMFVLIRDDALELRAELAEQDVMKLAPGQKVEMTAVGGDSLTGTVRLVEPLIDATSRMGRARISIDAPEGAVSGTVVTGMFLDATILVAEREALAVPVTAVGASDGGATVMRVTDGKVTRTKVVTGIRDGANIEVVSGLFQGDKVVARAAAFVRDGDRITPVEAQDAPPSN
jgi:HlyD family secretion protein